MTENKIPKTTNTPLPANDNAVVIGNAEPAPAVVEHRSDDETKPERVRTTPILGLHPAHSEAQIESRYLGYVQGVRKEADERALVAQKEAAEPVAKATKVKEDQNKAAKLQRECAEQEIERKHTKALQKLKSLRQSRLGKAKNVCTNTTLTAQQEFGNVAGPAAERLKVKLVHIANELSNKIIAAGKEYTPAKSRATALRQQAEAEEKARKEREAAELTALKELQEKAAKNENGDEKVLTKPAVVGVK
jgi:ribosomal protein L31E